MLPTAEGRLQKLAKSQMVHHQYLIAYSCKSPSHLELVLWSLLASPVGLVKKGKTKKMLPLGCQKQEMSFYPSPPSGTELRAICTLTEKAGHPYSTETLRILVLSFGIYSFHILPVTFQPWCFNNGSLLTFR